MVSLSTTLRTSWVLGFLVVISWLFQQSCSDRRSPECEAFLALSLTERQVEFRKQPADKQIDLYLCGMRGEPPDLDLADKITDRGEAVIPLLTQRLKTSQNEGEQEDLIYLFEVMSRNGHLRGRTDVVSAISDAVDNMKLARIKEHSQELLKKIRINSGVKPFTYVP